MSGERDTQHAELATTEIVYLGRRFLPSGKLGAYFIPREKLDRIAGQSASYIEKHASLYEAKGAPAAVGGVYSGEASVESDGLIRTLRVGSLKWLQPYASEIIDAFVAEDRVANARKQSALEEAKAAKETRLDRALDQLAFAYRQISPANRQAFKLMVLDRLDKGGRK